MSKLRHPHPDENDIDKSYIDDKIEALKLVNNRKYKNDDTRNLCFVNADIQIFYRIPDVKSYFEQTHFDDSQPICQEISRIFQNKGNNVASTAKLRKLVGESSGRKDVSDGSQQDIMEFHALVLRMVENESMMNDDTNGSRFVSQLYGIEKNEKAFLVVSQPLMMSAYFRCPGLKT